jgi:hypothetical protein
MRENGKPYHIELMDPGPNLVLIASQEVGTSQAKFTHPNMAAKATRLLEFKHYRPNGGKYWTRKAGIEFYFLVSKSNIELIEEPGYSYVQVMINGQRFTMSVSGGSFNGWTDFMGPVVNMGCGMPARMMCALAEAAHPAKSFPQDLEPRIHEMEDWEEEAWLEEAYRKVCLKALKLGHKLVLSDDYRLEGSRGPFEIIRKIGRQRKFVVHCKLDTGSGAMFESYVQYKCIGWHKTGLANDFILPTTPTVEQFYLG